MEDMNHFFEIETENGYIVDYDKIKSCDENTLTLFLTNSSRISERLFYPFYIYIILNNKKMSQENLSLAVNSLCNMEIDYEYNSEEELRYKVIRCDAAKELINNYIDNDLSRSI